MKRTSIVHLVAHLRPGIRSLCAPDRAAWLWTHLRAVFPTALGAVIMPDHVHVVTPDARRRAPRALGCVLGHFARRFAGTRTWLPSPPPTPVRDRKMLFRAIRYVLLNPCRDEHCGDPLEWTWSTHRDVMGAIADPWIDANRLRRAIGWRAADFRDRFHHYVSADPTSDVQGTPSPRPAEATTVPAFSLDQIARAATAATRAPMAALRSRGRPRDVFLRLAAHQGWRDDRLLAAMTQACARTVRRAATRPIDIDAARLCLGDRRLRTECHDGQVSRIRTFAPRRPSHGG